MNRPRRKFLHLGADGAFLLGRLQDGSSVRSTHLRIQPSATLRAVNALQVGKRIALAQSTAQIARFVDCVDHHGEYFDRPDEDRPACRAR